MKIKLLAVFIILTWLPGCYSSNPDRLQLVPEDGRLNLQKWNFQSDGPVRLSGEWEFYWNRFLDSSHFTAAGSQEPPAYIKLPGMWNDLQIDGRPLPGTGFATLRLQVNLSHAPQDLAFKFQDVYSAYSVFVNGKQIGSVGHISSQKEGSLDKNLPRVFNFTANSKDLEIIIHISNFTTIYGGSPQLILLGSQDDIQKAREQSLALDLFIIGGILIISFYHFGLYILRRKEISSLYFMLHCLSVAIYGSVTGECFLPFLLPDIDMDIVMRVVLLSAASSILWLMTFIRSILPTVFPRILLLFSNTVMTISCLSALVMPTIIYLNVHILFQMVMLFMLLATIIALIRGLIKRQFGSGILLGGFILLALSGFNDVLYFHAVLDTVYLVPLGLFVFIFSQALLLSVKFNKAFSLIEEMTEELDVKNRELSRLDKLKDDFLSNTSHELRTPLSGIIGIAESIAAGSTGEISAETRNHLSIITSSGKRLSKLINDILDFTKLRYDSLQLHIEPVELNAVVQTILPLMTPLAQSKKLFINTENLETPIIVKADKNRLQQILINLVGNAIKFTQTGGITIRAAETSDSVTVTISDTGIGIQPDKQKIIFESFEQLEESNTREQPGAGLGLAISKKLIELLDGEVHLQSQPGKGSDFSFSLPLAHTLPDPGERRSSLTETSPGISAITPDQKETAAICYLKQQKGNQPIDVSEEQHAAVNTELTDAKVLAVDDDPINLTVIQNFLGLSGAIAKTARSGPECLSILDTWKPDIILLDIMMPHMSGFETAERIRDIYGKHDLPIIFLTAKNQDRDLTSAFAAGANDYLVKPVSRSSLYIRINFHISMTRLLTDLKASDERLRRILDNTVEGIFQITDTGEITFANQAMATLFGYPTPAEMLNTRRPFSSLLANPIDIERVAERLANGEVLSYPEICFTRSDSSFFWGTVFIQTIHDVHNPRVVAEGMIFDITESREKNKAIQEQKFAREANQAKSEFLANITHELRTPLQGIIGYAGLGCKSANTLSREKLISYYEEILSSGNRLLTLINDLLDLSKLDSKQEQVFSYTRERLSSVINVIIQELFAITQKKQLNIHFGSPDFDDTILIDVEKIGQVIRNLLGNAIKFSNEGENIEIQLMKNQTALKCSISDHGLGIPAGELERIFGTFIQSSAHKNGAGGTGLGLAISQKIIEKHHGRIWAENNPEGGAVFSFTIPTQSEE